MPPTRRRRLGSRPCAASISNCPGECAKDSARRLKARQAFSTSFWSWWLSMLESSGTESATRCAHSTGRPRHMLAAVATARRCTPIAKKSTYCSTASMPPARKTASGCSCDSFSSACSACSARSMYSMESNRSQKSGTPSKWTMAAEEDGIASIMWHRARDASSMRSGLCSARSIPISNGVNASTLSADIDSSVPMESISHSSERDASCIPSSEPRRLARIVFSLPWDDDAEGRRSSRPAPSLRSKPCSALDGPPHSCPARARVADSSSMSRASCSAASSAACRRSEKLSSGAASLPEAPALLDASAAPPEGCWLAP
mmetsp:Transcript_13831/g.45208  ORF Transcript_13831/g.45208 Transcript_13831/m.45208 type:complete len:317 (+) Transcript_13831:3007-3957(+)